MLHFSRSATVAHPGSGPAESLLKALYKGTPLLLVEEQTKDVHDQKRPRPDVARHVEARGVRIEAVERQC